MEIVAHSVMLRKFRSINDFVIDLGSNYCGKVDNGRSGKQTFKLNISDDFINKYNKLTNRLISKCGNIGNITFYEDMSLYYNNFMIFDGKDVIDIEYTDEDDNKNIRQYLSDVLESINDKNEN